MNGAGEPCVALCASREAAGGSVAWGTRSPSGKLLIIGVTGGMASGKSTLARMISGRGIVHIDADKLVHALMQHDREMIAEIAAAFPGVVVQQKIDRAKLAGTISKHPTKLITLEHIIHPRVRALEEMAIAIARRNGMKAVILDIPLLFETDAQTLCDVVIVAHAPIHHRRRRAFTRPNMTEEKWQKLLARQLPDHARNHAADIVIPTGIGKAATRRVIAQYMHEWGLL